jgi:hypothetical protein
VPPSSGSKSKPTNKPAEAGIKQNRVVTLSPDCLVSQPKTLLSVITVRTSDPTTLLTYRQQYSPVGTVRMSSGFLDPLTWSWLSLSS